jgi:hypothetical protein
MTNDIRPQPTNRRDYTGQIISTQPAHQSERAENSQHSSQPRNKPRHGTGRKKIAAILALICICAVGLGIFFLKGNGSASPFPTGITSGLPYRVYLSTDTSSGYSYKAGSAKIQAGILFYTLANRSKKIFVTEQNVPTNTINLSSLPKHTNLDVPIGKAVIGTGLGNPSIVIMTSSTLVQLTSSKGVTKTDIISVAQKMSQQNL